MILFKIFYWLGIIAQLFVRAPYQKIWRSSAKTEQRVSLTERVLLALLAVVGILLPLVYTFTPWLGFADYHLPVWLGWLGLLFEIGGLVVFALAHRDLKAYWSPSLEIFADHQLMTEGIYARVRHPMYASQWLFSIAQLLLLQNWLAGPVTLLFFVPFYLLRVRAEEKLMLQTFGETYRAYMERTGAVLPKL